MELFTVWTGRDFYLQQFVVILYKVLGTGVDFSTLTLTEKDCRNYEVCSVCSTLEVTVQMWAVVVPVCASLV